MRRRSLLLLGAIAGLLSGMLGIGGGTVVGPILVLAGLPLLRASGTALAMIAPVSLAGVATEGFMRFKHLDPGLAAVLGIGGVLGVMLARKAALHLPELTLRRLFALLLFVTALRQFGVFGLAAVEHPGWFGAESVARLLLALGLGVFAGCSAILFGVGGGIVMVPGMVFAVGGLSIHEATAVSLLAMVPTAAYGGFVAWRDGRVDTALLMPLMVAAMGGAVAGVLVRNFLMAPLALSIAFGCFLLYVTSSLLRKPPAAGARRRGAPG